MSPLLKVEAAQVTHSGFIDACEHRRHLPAFYQAYASVQREDPQREDVRVLWMGVTGWLIDEWLVESEFFGARQIVLGSASSKTALCTAFMLGRRAGRGFELIGLTSARHREFCERTGYYDRVMEYAAVESLQAQTPTVLIDMSGSTEVRRRVHEHFQSALRHSSAVGLTHGKLPVPGRLPGPAPQFFSALEQIAKRQHEYGAEGFQMGLREAEAAFHSSALAWLQVVRVRGPAAIDAAYRSVLAGQIAPQQGLIMSL
jgi:hypothetical protein